MLIPLAYQPVEPDWTAQLADWMNPDDARNNTAALVVDEAGQVIGVVGSDDPLPSLEPDAVPAG